MSGPSKVGLYDALAPWFHLLTDAGFSTTSVEDPEGRIALIGTRSGGEAVTDAHRSLLSRLP